MLIAVIAGSALVFSFFAQFIWEIQPCVLCWYQRGALAVLAVVAILPWRWLTRATAFCAVLLSLYQVGVEQHLWRHPGCVDNSPVIALSGKSEAEKLQILKEQAARPMIAGCDQIPWRIWGVSATVWTFLLCIFLNGMAWYDHQRWKTNSSRD